MIPIGNIFAGTLLLPSLGGNVGMSFHFLTIAAFCVGGLVLLSFASTRIIRFYIDRS